ncbi:hypothetical protein PIB30_097063, partial [Stylosanthes scabra]|nr:hypothetical protein [Stylosanthes scabra]
PSQRLVRTARLRDNLCRSKRYSDGWDSNPNEYDSLGIWDFRWDYWIQWIFPDGTKQSVGSSCIGNRIYYSPPPFGGHNFHTGAPIDAPFAATRSSHHLLHFYTTFEILVVLGAFQLEQGP